MAAVTVLAATVLLPPRSAGGWLVEVLWACGVDAEHEWWWRVRDDPDVARPAVDVSWPACLRGPVGTHRGGQVRDPVAAVRSLTRSPGHPQHLAMVGWDYTSPQGAVRLVADCLEQVLTKAERWWRVEDVTPDDVAWVCARAGRPVTIEQVGHAIASVPRDVNSRDPVPPPQRGEPDPYADGRLRALAADCGYV